MRLLLFLALEFGVVITFDYYCPWLRVRDQNNGKKQYFMRTYIIENHPVSLLKLLFYLQVSTLY